MIRGKGLYVWNADNVLRRSRSPSAQEAARLARSAGLEHAIVKIADGTNPFPLPGKPRHSQKEAITGDLIRALREVGIEVWGWAFAYGPRADPEAQAEVFAARARQFGISGLVIDAEDFRNRIWSSPLGAAAARAYVKRLRSEMAGTPELIVGLSSYRYIRYHRSFPFAEFLDECDVAMPQVYWAARSGGDAVRNLQDSYEDYKAAFPHTLFLPTGAAYGAAQGSDDDRWLWSATPDQITRFLDQAQAMRLPGVTFWSWEHALNDPGNPLYPGAQLWNAIAGYDYHPGQQEFTAGNQPESAFESPAIGEQPLLAIAVGQTGYSDGLNPRLPEAMLHTFSLKNRVMKYASSTDGDAGVWALWSPRILKSGQYKISVWVPAIHADSRRACYQIHGVVGQPGAVLFQVSQDRFFDEWVSLGAYELDSNHPQSGHILLTNVTGETGREVGLADITWQMVETGQTPPSRPLADGFDSPVGTEAERRSNQVWPGKWIDATGHNVQYTDSSGKSALHTGADLNLNAPRFDADAGAPVYAVASGVVTFAGRLAVWGNVVIIQHDPLEPGGGSVCSRSGHLASMSVSVSQRVERGQEIGRIGHPVGGPNHLHFDISPTTALLVRPSDWPGLDRPRLLLHYVDPRAFIQVHRP